MGRFTGIALALALWLAGCTGGRSPAATPAPAPRASGPAPAPAAAGATGPAADPGPLPDPLPPAWPPPGYTPPETVTVQPLAGEWAPPAPAAGGGATAPGQPPRPLAVEVAVDAAGAPLAAGAPVGFRVGLRNLSAAELRLEPVRLLVEVRLQGRPLWRGELPPLGGRLAPGEERRFSAAWNQRDADGRPVPGGQAYELALVSGSSVRYSAGGPPLTAVLTDQAEAVASFALTLEGAVTGTAFGPFPGGTRDGEVRASVTRVYMTPGATVLEGLVQGRGARPPDTTGLHLVAILPSGEVELPHRDQQYREAPAPDPGYGAAEGFTATFAPVPAAATALRLVKVDPDRGAGVWQVLVPLPGAPARAGAPPGAGPAIGAWARQGIRELPDGLRGFPLAAALTLNGSGNPWPTSRPVSYRVRLVNASPQRLTLTGVVLRVQARLAGDPAPIWAAELPPLALELGPGEMATGDFAWDRQDALGQPVPPGRTLVLALVPTAFSAAGARGPVAVTLEPGPRTQAAFTLAFPPGGAAVATLAGRFTGYGPDGSVQVEVERVQLTEAGALVAGAMYLRPGAAPGGRGPLQLTALTPGGGVRIQHLGLLPGGTGAPDPTGVQVQRWEASFDPVPAAATALVLQELAGADGPARWTVQIPLPGAMGDGQP